MYLDYRKRVLEIIGVPHTVKDGKITIDKDGIYKVIAYTYGEEGNKSRITYEIIKVNKTGIEATINYSTTESTTDPVIATVTFNKEGIKITNKIQIENVRIRNFCAHPHFCVCSVLCSNDHIRPTWKEG